MAFKHGVLGEHSAYVGKQTMNANGTIPVYIGTAPIHQINAENAANYDYNDAINKPIVLTSYPDAIEKIGVSSDFKAFTLMEAVYAHFRNGKNPIAPIVVVNMADPAKQTAEETEATITLSGIAGKKVGYLDDSAAIIETVAIDELTKDTDYTLAYFDGKIKITITKSGYTGGTVTASYKKIDTSDAVITTAEYQKALDALDICEIATGYIPTVAASPYYSSIKEYHDLLIAKATNRLDGKWYVDVVTDIKADSTTDTLAKAITKKATDGYNSVIEKVCYPKVKYNGAIYHLSTMCVVDMQQTDTNADGVPYISPSNKRIYADAAVLEDGKQIYINETAANTANANGLTTVNVVRSELRLWGGCNGNYNHSNEANIDPEYLQDVGVRMKHYILNKFQYDYINNIDAPLSRRDIDSVIASVQQWLNSLINEGKLLYAKVSFIADNNSVKDMLSGDFVFDTSYTHTPNAKSLTFRTHYTTEGISSLTTGGAE